MNSVTEQLRVFAVCVFIGVTSGLIYDILGLTFSSLTIKNSHGNLIKMNNNGKFFSGFDLKVILYFILSAFYFKIIAYIYYFPSFRVYFLFGFLIGVICYLKSFHKAFAILNNLVYNKINKVYKKIAYALSKTFKLALAKFRKYNNERRKKAQSSVGNGFGRDNVTIYISSNSGVSNRRHLRKKKQNTNA